MVMRVQRVGEEYRIVLSPEALEALHLTDGAEVEIRRVGPGMTTRRAKAKTGGGG